MRTREFATMERSWRSEGEAAVVGSETICVLPVIFLWAANIPLSVIFVRVLKFWLFKKEEMDGRKANAGRYRILMYGSWVNLNLLVSPAHGHCFVDHLRMDFAAGRGKVSDRKKFQSCFCR